VRRRRGVLRRMTGRMTTSPTFGRHTTAGWSVCIALIAMAFGFAAPAAANSYDVAACDAAYGVNNSWQAITTAPSVAAYASCPSGGNPRRGLIARNLVTSGSVPGGTSAQMRFTAVPGTSIVGIRAGYDFYRRDGRWEVGLSNGSRLV